MTQNDIASQPIGAWLEDLASSSPAPGGGAAAALNVAVGAALIEMVCNLTIGKPRYAAHEATMTKALAEAGAVRQKALRLAEEDAAAFSAVTAAYRLPKDTPDQESQRAAAIQEALVGAADVPVRTAETASEVVGLAGQILDGANENVLSDVAVAAASARAGYEAAVVNVEINKASIDDAGHRGGLVARMKPIRRQVDESLRILAAVNRRVGTP